MNGEALDADSATDSIRTRLRGSLFCRAAIAGPGRCAVLTPMRRENYKEVWNTLSGDVSSAKIHVCGTDDEAALATATVHTLNVLRATVGIRPEDDCLEIGCGVGRVGRGLAPLVRSWTGCDVAPNMVRHARDRLAGLGNVRVREISGYALDGIPDASCDLVYCTVVFMHLDGWDRYSYVKEAFRVLRSGGRFFCDNTNLLTDDGWEQFERYRTSYHPTARPPHIGKCSTPQELGIYLQRAGFGGVRTRTRHLWVDAWGTK
jgi:ubiquinone/menaquinone biosynthesis C-methylase UbiE